MSPRHWAAWSLFVVIGVGLFCSVSSDSKGENKAGDAGQGQSKWEYKVVGREGNQDIFNDLGEQG